MSGLLDDGPRLTEAEEALLRIIRICEQSQSDPNPTWGQYVPKIDTVARTYFLDQLSRESHEFE